MDHGNEAESLDFGTAKLIVKNIFFDGIFDSLMNCFVENKLPQVHHFRIGFSIDYMEGR